MSESSGLFPHFNNHGFAQSSTLLSSATPWQDVAAIVFERVWLAGDFVQCVFWGEVLHGHRRYKYMQYECMNRNCFVALWNCSIQDALKTPTKSPLEAFIVHHNSDCFCININRLRVERRYYGIYRQSRISRRTNSLAQFELPGNTTGDRLSVWHNPILDARCFSSERHAII